jgi:hypothetical protein
VDGRAGDRSSHRRVAISAQPERKANLETKAGEIDDDGIFRSDFRGQLTEAFRMFGFVA